MIVTPKYFEEILKSRWPVIITGHLITFTPLPRACQYCNCLVEAGQIRCDSCGAPVLETKPVNKLETK